MISTEYPPRTGEEHRRLSFEYRALSTDEERDDFFSKHGVRWTEFSRLSYFDIVRHTIVDPMHNLLLGVAKTQWYNRWIQTNALRTDTTRKHRELHLIHDFLETFESPLWAGRLPLRVGEPAGGSLTADEYKFAVTSPWAMIVCEVLFYIPIVWDTFLKDADKDHVSASTKYTKAKEDWEKEMRRRARNRGKNKDDDPPEPQEPSPRMTKGEDFLHTWVNAVQIYGTENMKPNHHWAIHIPDQIRDYGPMYSFWAFLTERLNKILKNLNSNNWTGGHLEVSMMREFCRSASLDGVV
ncbi:hypothetical protein K438DRAFT_1445334, partial [Mycena galopus ATCC 62051]